MGKVYRAHDKRLRRDVALKVLPDVFAHDPDRVVLFQREAKVIASLNHPNIATIHEFEESATFRWLVLELVPGETLEERLKRGPLKIAEALSIAKQICDALEAAHDKGIIHRDLKPANIKITPDQKVKLLDFGLASAFEVNPRTTDLNGSPTLPAPDSVPHAGTAAYMSPEQFQWKNINKQVDIWAFGCVLFEMLAGTYIFQAGTLRETATQVLESEPDWSRLKHAPPELADLVRRCLEKDRRIRLHDIADARIEIDRLLGNKPIPTVPEAEAFRRNSKWLWVLAAGLFFVGAFLLLFAFRREAVHEPLPTVRFSIPVSRTNSITQISVSPDGRKIAYVAGNALGGRIIWIREVDNPTAKPLPDAEDPGGMFWAPDNDSIAFLSRGELRVVDVSHGYVQTIGPAPGATSGSWSKSNGILVDGSEGSGVFRISKAGVRTPVTSPDRSIGERHYQPQFLPDGRHFLFLVKTNQPDTTGIYLGSLDSNQRQFLTKASGKAMFSGPSHILFVRDGALLRQRFQMNPPQLTGEPVRIAEHVSSSGTSGSAAFGVSLSGVLAYRSGSAFENSALQWFDRQGRKVGTTAEPAVYTQVVMSPDDKHIGVELRDPDLGSYNIWLADPAKNTTTRLTFGDSSERNPVWWPDSHHLLYTSDKPGWSLMRVGIDSTSSPEVILKSDETFRPMDITSDGSLLLRDQFFSFFKLGPGDGHQPEMFLQTSYRKIGGRLSPNGKWLAFNSTDSGRDEVYVVPFPNADRRQRISTNGGVQPQWNSSGTEMFFLDLQGHIMATTISGTNMLTAGIPTLLFDAGITSSSGMNQYAVNRTGTRFLVIKPVTDQEASPIDVIVGWSGSEP
jgi:serine/threonine protein kinase